jgi:hypothetical protein
MLSAARLMLSSPIRSSRSGHDSVNPCLAWERGLVDQGVPQVFSAQHRDHALPVVVGVEQVVDDAVHVVPFGGDSGVMATLSARRFRVAESLPCCVQERQVGRRPGPGVRALQPVHVVEVEPGRALAQVGGYRPQAPDDVGSLDYRPRPIEGRDQVSVSQQRPAELVLRNVVPMVFVHDDRD